MRNVKVTIRLSLTEYDSLLNKTTQAFEQGQIHRRGASVSEYIRQLVKKGYVVDINTLSNNLSALRVELNKIGTNINQLAYKANVGGYDDSIHSQLIEEIDKAKAALSKILKAAK